MHNIFGGKSLHYIDPTFNYPPPPSYNASSSDGISSGYSQHFAYMNPYQKVISIICRTLGSFDEDGLIPVYGFGDMITKDSCIFNFKDRQCGSSTISADAPCHGMEDVLDTYTNVIPLVKLSGPTSFAPLINHVTKLLKKSKQYNILLIIADGQINDNGDTVKAIKKASKDAPLSIVTIGVGDGPWETMEKYDDTIKGRKFDNFQFVNFNSIEARYPSNLDVAFSIAALQEIPIQYEYLRNKKRIK